MSNFAIIQSVMYTLITELWIEHGDLWSFFKNEPSFIDIQFLVQHFEFRSDNHVKDSCKVIDEETITSNTTFIDFSYCLTWVCLKCLQKNEKLLYFLVAIKINLRENQYLYRVEMKFANEKLCQVVAQYNFPKLNY